MEVAVVTAQRRVSAAAPPKFLAERGFALALIDLQEPSETLAALKSRNVDSLSCTADITNETAISESASAVEVRSGRVNVLVNNAGVSFIAPAETITAKDYRRVAPCDVSLPPTTLPAP